MHTLFQADIFASVSSNDTLMRIHATAEEYDKAAEELFSTIQVSARQPLSHNLHVITYCDLLHTVMFCTYTAASANLRLVPKYYLKGTWLGRMGERLFSS